MLYIKQKGSVGYSIVGSPTIVDGVASGFSASNYLQIEQTYNATNNGNVQIYVRAKTPTTITSSFNPIFGADNIGLWGISSYSTSLFTIRMGYSNGTSFTFGDMYITGGVQEDTWYRFKITGNNGIWRAEIYNDSGTLLNSSDKDWSNTTLNENYTIKIKCTDNTNAYSGEIDLNNTYIKVNGQAWFGVCPVEVNKHQIMGPVGYTVVGSPTITNGVMSSYNASNYLKFSSQTFNPGSGSFEIQLDYTVGNSATDYGYSLCLPGMNINQPGGMGSFRVNFRTTSENFYLQTSKAANTNYVLKVTYDGNGLYSLYSNGVLADSKSNTQLDTTADSWDYTIGIRENSTTSSINLNNTYVKVNGKLWFWQPRETERIVVNGVQVWQKPS